MIGSLNLALNAGIGDGALHNADGCYTFKQLLPSRYLQNGIEFTLHILSFTEHLDS